MVQRHGLSPSDDIGLHCKVSNIELFIMQNLIVIKSNILPRT